MESIARWNTVDKALIIFVAGWEVHRFLFQKNSYNTRVISLYRTKTQIIWKDLCTVNENEANGRKRNSHYFLLKFVPCLYYCLTKNTKRFISKHQSHISMFFLSCINQLMINAVHLAIFIIAHFFKTEV